METIEIQSGQKRGDVNNALRQRALLLDLEVSQSVEAPKVLKMGVVLGDRTFYRSGRFSLGDALSELSTLVGGAMCVLGHNLIRHDLRVLREFAPNHPLHSLPVVDTLFLSPIAFPENPYHRLVKDYKLVRESLNDPISDARQAAALFEDEMKSLAGLRQSEPAIFSLLHFLLATPSDEQDTLAMGMEMVFIALGGHRPSREQALVLCRDLLPRWACAGFPVSLEIIQNSSKRWALAYAVTWLRVAGSNSVLPPWVRMEHPLTGQLLIQMRDQPCFAETCLYCRRVHNSREQLKTFFGFEDFRMRPENGRGGSMQQDIIEAGLRNESLLAILPTGGGKSLCFQLPALVRNYRRGLLTIVISPLQALMKDQVDGLARRTGTLFAAALYGMLTPPERGDVLRRVQRGDVAILYVSPEQLRNRSFRAAIASREIGCWVFDEAHCLSKWGHDFRTDYLYAGRFIREYSSSQGVAVPSIACFTATAKLDVQAEIVAYFKNELGLELRLFEGGVERDNLVFEIQTVSDRGKMERTHDLLSDLMPPAMAGSAIVFRSTRDGTQVIADYLCAKGWSAAHFHAGLSPMEKKRIQDDFLSSKIRVICATNAFGMGIDKDDVRLVIHADMPASLENYLQEAGRAGRDGKRSHCVLLFDPEDCEHQFRMGAFSELSRRDIAQILRGLRKAARGGREEVVITTGEILRDQEIETDIDLLDRNADTKVRTAISWLERSGFLHRDENVTSVFQARPLVRNLEEAQKKLDVLNLSVAEQSLWLAILRALFTAGQTGTLTVDQLVLLPEFAAYARGGPSGALNPEYMGAKVLKILGSMSQVGLVKRDLLLNAFIRYKIADHSGVRLDRVLHTDRKLLDLLSVEEPDPEGWMPLLLRPLNQKLLNEGCLSSPDIVRSLLKSLSEDGRGLAGNYGSIDLLYLNRESYRVRVRRNWSAMAELAEKRRRVATLIVERLLSKIPAGTAPSGELLVEFSFEELRNVVEQDMLLRSELKDIDAAVERALMFLHEQQVLVLQQGLAVFRSAMTIRLKPENKGEKYKASDYQPLSHHYGERTLQVHVISEYARRGLGQIQEALELVLAYFTLEKEAFTRQYFGSRPDLLKYATTAQSYQRIVTDLENPEQIKIVTASTSRNRLILAGPGSGKTKTVVHRCAFLLRVERIRPQSILVCCFSRNAAVELRRRLADLVGHDARGVTILTYHGLAMRLLGYSLVDNSKSNTRDVDFDQLIQSAVKLLRGDEAPAGVEANEARDRLMSGFQHILVDEYQDIDEPQYQMISALAGRALDDPDLKLSILAVGDDDQNIFSFRGANVQFIRRFQQDYDAEVHYLVENYRSTRNIIYAANELISANKDRMKTGHPIQIDRWRSKLPAGGRFGDTDDQTKGLLQVISVNHEWDQPKAVLAEVHRLRNLGVNDWNSIAVLSSTHRELAMVRALAEAESIPVRWFASRSALPQLHQIRECQFLLQHLSEQRNSLQRASVLREQATRLFAPRPPSPWTDYVFRLLNAWQNESDDAELPVQSAIEFIYESCAEHRRDFSFGEGINLSTVHSAKGCEYDHVLLLGAWPVSQSNGKLEEARRAFYVGMTRARQSLCIFDCGDIQPSLPGSLAGRSILRRRFLGPTSEFAPSLVYTMLSLEDINLGYPAQFDETHPIHQGLARLMYGGRMQIRADNTAAVSLHDHSGVCLAKLSNKASAYWYPLLHRINEVRVVGMVQRCLEQTDPAYRERCRLDRWEIPLVEIVMAGK